MGKRIVSKEIKKASKARRDVNRVLMRSVFEYLHSLDNPVVMEIGAFTGMFIGKVYEAIPGAKIYAIEPLKSNIKKLRRFPNLEILEGAVSDTRGTVKMYISDLESRRENIDCSMHKESAKKNNAGIKGSVEVPSYTLSSVWGYFGLERVDLMSINCEGGEYHMFGDSGVFDRTGAVYIHMHTKTPFFLSPEYRRKREEIVEILRGKGFKMEGMDDLGALAHIVQFWRK